MNMITCTALTWANCPLADFGLGVDPRFAVELVGYGQLAAVTSRVGWDQVDLAKLQEGTVDVQWMSKVAVRHNEIIGAGPTCARAPDATGYPL